MYTEARLIALLLLMLWGSVRLPAQDVDTVATEEAPLSLFEFLHQQDSLPLLRLDTDWGNLIRQKMREEYQPGVLSFHGMNGSLVSLNTRVRARGNIRKQVCFYPPVKIKAKKAQLKNLGFKPINEFKLVLPCKPARHTQLYVVREALAYHLYEAIHPIHIKTKLVQLEMWKDGEEQEHFIALLVEHEEELTARLNAKVVGKGVLRSSALERDAYLKMCFFQYMISNTDWAIANRHNLEMLSVPGTNRVVAVPYDFDYAGFSGTSYAVPFHALPIDDVNERYFMGRNVTEEEALEMARFFLSKKEEILRRCSDFGHLEEKDVERLHRNLEKFFDLLEHEKKVKRTFVTTE